MPFELTPEDLKRSQKCPPGMHIFTVTAVDEEYLNDNGTTVQRMEFESDKGYMVSTWFNNKFQSSVIEFVQAADKITFTEESIKNVKINLKDYLGKKVAGSVSHRKDNNNKIQAQIDNFFSADKVPF